MINRFVVETLRTFGPPFRWPLLWFEAMAAVIRHFDDPAFRGRHIRYGDGKPLLLVPGHFAGDATLFPLAMWLRAIGYRPTQFDVLINLDDRLLDKSLAAATDSSYASCPCGRIPVPAMTNGTGPCACARVRRECCTAV